MDRRTILVVSVFFLLAVIGILVGVLTGGETPNRASVMSRSVIGHRAVVELLERNEFRIFVNRKTNPRPEEGEGLVVFAPSPPSERPEEQPSWRRLSEQFSPELIVLPKWQGIEHPERADWFYITQRYENEVIEKLLPKDTDWSVDVRSSSGGDEDAAGTTHEVRSANGRRIPVRSQGLQVIDASDQAEVLWRVDGVPVVLREPGSDRIWVSDPDLLSNMFLDQEQNAAFALALFQEVFPERRFLVDELHHGYGIEGGVLELLFTFPGVVLTISAVFLMVCFYWSLYCSWSGQEGNRTGNRRRREQAEAMGRLTHAHGNHPYAARQYLSNMKSLIAEAVNLPGDEDWNGIVRRLDHLRPSLADQLRSVVEDRDVLRGEEVREQQLLEIVRQAHTVYRQLRDELSEGTAEPAPGRN